MPPSCTDAPNALQHTHVGAGRAGAFVAMAALFLKDAAGVDDVPHHSSMVANALSQLQSGPWLRAVLFAVGTLLVVYGSFAAASAWGGRVFPTPPPSRRARRRGAGAGGGAAAAERDEEEEIGQQEGRTPWRGGGAGDAGAVVLRGEGLGTAADDKAPVGLASGGSVGARLRAYVARATGVFGGGRDAAREPASQPVPSASPPAPAQPLAPHKCAAGGAPPRQLLELPGIVGPETAPKDAAASPMPLRVASHASVGSAADPAPPAPPPPRLSRLLLGCCWPQQRLLAWGRGRAMSRPLATMMPPGRR